jgi:hypothetical protein
LKLDPDSKVADKATDAIVSLRSTKAIGAGSSDTSDGLTGTWQILRWNDATNGNLEGAITFRRGAGGKYECEFTIYQASETCTATVVNDQVNIRSQLAEPLPHYSPDNFLLTIVEPGVMNGLLLSNVSYRIQFLKEGSGKEARDAGQVLKELSEKEAQTK